MHDTRTPVLTGMAAVVVNILASLLLMGPLGVTGLALATAVASGWNFLLLFVCLRRRIGLLGGWRILRAGARVVVACGPMAVWGILAQRWWDALAAPGALQGAAVLCGELLVAVAIFAVSAALLRCEEVGWTLGVLRRGRGRRLASTRISG
jgi:putative peptidoglycan lipid II flippase